MIELILGFFGKALYPILAGAGALLFVLFQRWRIKKKNELIDRQEAVIQAHEKIEEVHKQDSQADQETDMRIDALREKVNHAETPEQGAGEVSGAINEYFSGDKKG